jgi:hypothetical protein
LTAILCTALFLAAPPLVAAADDPPQSAELAAAQFLEMVDKNLLKQSYELTAETVRRTESPILWYGALSSEVGPVGRAEERKLVGAEKREDFGDLPDGEYLAVIYRTRFAKQPEATETVVLQQDPDGMWGVAGYRVDYNRWPEALRIIGSGLVIVFLIMSLLACTTWAVGRVIQSAEKKKAETGKSE